MAFKGPSGPFNGLRGPTAFCLLLNSEKRPWESLLLSAMDGQRRWPKKHRMAKRGQRIAKEATNTRSIVGALWAPQGPMGPKRLLLSAMDGQRSNKWPKKQRVAK